MTDRNDELKNVTYEIFVGLLSVLSIINIALYYLIPSEDVQGVLAIMDAILSVIFMSDFVFRLFSAESKSDYFFRQFGWADLLASLPLPQLKILRLFRLFRAGRMLRDYGTVGIFREYMKNRANSALLSMLLIVILLLEFGSMFVLSFEQYAEGANIVTGGDAVWYTFVTITTVGYGDRFPTTPGGRLFGMLIMAIGVGVFGTLTGYLSNLFLSAPSDEEEPVSAAERNSLDDEGEVSLAELMSILMELQSSQATLETKIDRIEARS